MKEKADRNSSVSFTILMQARDLMELFEVTLEEDGDCHIGRARGPDI